MGFQYLHRSPYFSMKPDIVYIDKDVKIAWVIDVAVPADCHVKDKETEKVDKYQDLCLQIQQIWNMRTIVIPIVVGALRIKLERL